MKRAPRPETRRNGLERQARERRRRQEILSARRRARRRGAARAAGLRRRCRECGCTDLDCLGCIERTGAPCWWVEANLCSACVEVAA